MEHNTFFCHDDDGDDDINLLGQNEYRKTNYLVYSLVIKLFSSCMMTCR